MSNITLLRVNCDTNTANRARVSASTCQHVAGGDTVSRHVSFSRGTIRLHVQGAADAGTPVSSARRAARKKRDKQRHLAEENSVSDVITQRQQEEQEQKKRNDDRDDRLKVVCYCPPATAWVDTCDAATNTDDNHGATDQLTPHSSTPQRARANKHHHHLATSAPSVWHSHKHHAGGLRSSSCELTPADSGVDGSEEEAASPVPHSEQSLANRNKIEQCDREEEYIVVCSEKIEALEYICSFKQQHQEEEETSSCSRQVKTSSPTSSDSALCSETLSSCSTEDYQDICCKVLSTLIENCEQSCSSETLHPLTRENLRRLNKQEYLHSETQVLQVPASLLQLNERLLQKAEMNARASQAGHSADLYTVLGGTVRGYPSSWSQLGSEFDRQQLPDENIDENTNNSYHCNSVVSDKLQHVINNGDWTVGRRRTGGTSSSSSSRVHQNFTSPERISQQAHHQVCNTRSGGQERNHNNISDSNRLLKRFSSNIDDSESDGSSWYPHCTVCSQLVYPQDSVPTNSPSCVFHQSCLRCGECGVALRQGEVGIRREKEVYCQLHGSDDCTWLCIKSSLSRTKLSHRTKITEFARVKAEN